MDSSRDIEARAGEWLARRESGDWSAEEQACFTQWLDSSIANRVAFLRQEAAWEHALRLQALRGHTPPGSVPSPEDWRLSPFISDGTAEPHSPQAGAESLEAEPKNTGTVHTRRGWIRGTLAASLMLAVAGAVTWYVASSGPYYHTAVGGIASVPMSDGSKVTLNTESAIRLDVSESERRVQLERGEAFFEVAKDPNRPFVVTAGNKRVVAVGTKFSVRRDGSDLRVFVTEGKVRFEDDSLLPTSAAPTSRAGGSAASSGAVKQRDDANVMLLTAGAVARAGESGVIVQEKPLPEVEDYLSWRSGYLTFRDIPLADAIAEFNRYNERKIFIQDPTVAAIRFSGKVRPTSSEGFVRLLEDAFGIRAEQADGRIVLTVAQ